MCACGALVALYRGPLNADVRPQRSDFPHLHRCIRSDTLGHVYQIQRTEVFSKWLAGLRDAKGTARILARLDSVRLGNLGDSKSLGGGLHEMRIFAGPGYRLYFAPRGEIVIILLCGGDKSSQQRDIARARRLLAELE